MSGTVTLIRAVTQALQNMKSGESDFFLAGFTVALILAAVLPWWAVLLIAVAINIGLIRAERSGPNSGIPE